MIKQTKIIIFALIILTIVSLNYNIILYKDNQYLTNEYSLNKCLMQNKLNDSLISKDILNGLYVHGKDFYCVWTENRTKSQIEKTDYHENCHNLVENNYEHFCLSKNVLIGSEQ